METIGPWVGWVPVWIWSVLRFILHWVCRVLISFPLLSINLATHDQAQAISRTQKTGLRKSPVLSCSCSRILSFPLWHSH